MLLKNDFVSADAQQLDQQDPLQPYRNQFHLPIQSNGEPYLYFCGNSLGLQPKSAQALVSEVMEDWAKLGVEGHFHAQNPWMPYHELLTESMAKIVGAHPLEVVVMNTLSVNLHLMMVSFYRPTARRYKILIESDAFPSDRYAVESQLKWHGYDPSTALLELRPRKGEETIRTEDIEGLLAEEGESIALIMLGGVNYYTGQYFDLAHIADIGHQHGCTVGYDLAHGAGNIQPNLHAIEADFAVWCTYKYLNAGPGNLGGCFVHERHAQRRDLPRFTGWWGHRPNTRFQMRDAFDPMPGAEGWQLSNPPIIPLAAMRASLAIFEEVGMDALRAKSLKLTAYMEALLEQLGKDKVKVITPSEPEARGCQLSIQVKDADKGLFERLSAKGVIADWREPDVIRVAPAPLYNTFSEVKQFVELLKSVF